VAETHRIDGQLLREIIKRDRASLAPGARLGASYWVDLAGKLGRGSQRLETLKPSNQDMCNSNQTLTLTLVRKCMFIIMLA